MEWTNKKFISILMLFCLLFFIGCGETKDDVLRKRDLNAIKFQLRSDLNPPNKERQSVIADGLIKALGDKSSKTRLYAAERLGMMGYNKAVKALILALKDINPHVREMAAWSLGNIKLEKKEQVKVHRSLLKVLNDKDSNVSNTAKYTLKKIEN